MKKTLLLFLILLFLTAWASAQAPINHYTERSGNITTVMSYPKYYLDQDSIYREANLTIEVCSDSGWNWQVVKGVYKLRADTLGRFEVNHLGDVYILQVKGIGFFNSTTKETVTRTNVIMPEAVVDSNTITWTLGNGITYALQYEHDNFRDILFMPHSVKVYLRNNLPSWQANRTWMALIYDCDLSGSNFIESYDFETDEDINFISGGRIKHKIAKAFTKHELYNPDPESSYTELQWPRKRFYRNGKYVEAIRVDALNSINGGLIFNTTSTFQEGVSGYSGADHIEIYKNQADTNQDPTSITAEFARATETVRRQTILIFDLSSINSSDIIISSELKVYGNGVDRGSADFDIGASKRVIVFDEATWNSYSTGNSWETAGGEGANDRYSADDEITITSADDSVMFDVTTSTANFVDGTWTNNGWITNLTDFVASPTPYWVFHTEHAATASNRPLLTVVHEAAKARRRHILLGGQ